MKCSEYFLCDGACRLLEALLVLSPLVFAPLVLGQHAPASHGVLDRAGACATPLSDPGETSPMPNLHTGG